MARACSGYNHGQSLIVHIQNNLLLVGWWFSICSIQGWGCNEAWSYWNCLAVSRGLKDVVKLLNIAIFEESMLNHISNFVWWFLSSIPNERGWTWYMFERKHTFSQDSPTTNSQKTVFLRFIGRKLSWPCEPWNYEVRSHWYTLRSSL